MGLDSVQARRFRRAVALVLVLTAAAVCVLSFQAQATARGGDAAESDSLVRQIWPEVKRGATFADAARAAGMEIAVGKDAPAWFADEVIDPAAAEGLMATVDWSVAWFSASGTARACMEDTAARLSGNGWVGYAGGADSVATFTKNEGVCTWLMVSCMEVGDSTQVVIRLC